jgi:hypothetical protein
LLSGAWRNGGRLAVALILAGALRAGEIWRLDNLEKLGGHAVTLEGAPRVTEMDGSKAVVFDGAKDGFFLSAIPIKGAKTFTIEILFWPAEGGPAEQRFVHLQDEGGARAMIETRLDGKGKWWLDTFLLPAGTQRGVALIDAKLVHPTNQWHWAALTYDGKMMTHYVNGVKELEGAPAMTPFGEGKTSLGVRQNKVHWFKGAIREVRFHAEALAPEKLQRVKSS